MLCRETLCVSDGIADRAFCLGQQATPLFVGMVVGWCTDDVLVATLDDQQMAVLNTADEFDALATLTLVDGLGEVLVQVIYQHAGIFCLQIATVVCDDFPILKSDDIAADGKVVVSHFIAYRCSLQGSATFVNLI